MSAGEKKTVKEQREEHDCGCGCGFLSIQTTIL